MDATLLAQKANSGFGPSPSPGSGESQEVPNPLTNPAGLFMALTGEAKQAYRNFVLYLWRSGFQGFLAIAAMTPANLDSPFMHNANPVAREIDRKKEEWRRLWQLLLDEAYRTLFIQTVLDLHILHKALHDALEDLEKSPRAAPEKKRMLTRLLEQVHENKKEILSNPEPTQSRLRAIAQNTAKIYESFAGIAQKAGTYINNAAQHVIQAGGRIKRRLEEAFDYTLH